MSRCLKGAQITPVSVASLHLEPEAAHEVAAIARGGPDKERLDTCEEFQKAARVLQKMGSPSAMQALRTVTQAVRISNPSPAPAVILFEYGSFVRYEPVALWNGASAIRRTNLQTGGTEVFHQNLDSGTLPMQNIIHIVTDMRFIYLIFQDTAQRGYIGKVLMDNDNGESLTPTIKFIDLRRLLAFASNLSIAVPVGVAGIRVNENNEVMAVIIYSLFGMQFPGTAPLDLVPATPLSPTFLQGRKPFRAEGSETIQQR